MGAISGGGVYKINYGALPGRGWRATGVADLNEGVNSGSGNEVDSDSLQRPTQPNASSSTSSKQSACSASDEPDSRAETRIGEIRIKHNQDALRPDLN